MNTPNIRITTIKGYHDHILRNVTNRTPKQRLEFFRSIRPADWRAARETMHAPDSRPLWPGYNSRNSGTKYETRRPVMVTHSGAQFRNEQDAHEVDGVRMDHTGWYSDADCSRLLIAFVFSLPHGRFGCGYRDDDSGERVYYPCVFDNARDAASFADSEAQYYAEQEKEYSERWQAMQDLKRDIEASEKAIKRLYALRNAGVDDDVRDELREAVDTLRDERKKLADEFADIDE